MSDAAPAGEHGGERRRAGVAAGALPWQTPGYAPSLIVPRLLARFKSAAIGELEARRLFLWVPVAAGAGVVIHLTSDHEPALWLTGALAAATSAAAFLSRQQRWLFAILVALAAVFAGMFSAGWRTERVRAPVLDRIRILTISGHVEQIDLRREGARLVLKLDRAEGLAPEATPYRVRLTTRKDQTLDAGAYVTLKARLLPPSHAALPGGYDFARDAYFARLGAVGSVLGKIEIAEPPAAPGLLAQMHMSIDRARNALARRVAASVEGDAGAIAVAMVTGKRDFLTEEARDLVREAGIFHIITISGIQMTLVAGILLFSRG
ncbi:MAG: ComEC/Rec2 family competence protein [Beijerinckiaceae bacterium]|nr:ComEC/Rec2 family competence protein [Beijerinckiaceae bacterium]